MPRTLYLLVAVAACGRVAFDPIGADAEDGANDALRTLCTFSKVTIVRDDIAVDDGVGATLAAALANGCGTAPATRTVSQDDPGILDADGRPLLARDDLAVIGGGDGPQRAIAYLLARDTPVVWTGTSPVTFREQATGRIIVTGPTSPSHDFALVMVVAEPIGGVRVLSASGLGDNGTIAAGQWFENQIAPTITTNTDTWTLVEWTDTDGNSAPSAGDQFTVIESGR
jgi:hypothetical protein